MIITGLTNGTPYTVRVAAVNAVGQGPYVTSGSVTPSTVPGAPISVLTTTAGDSLTTISWSAPVSTGGSAITGYRVERSPSPYSTWTEVATVGNVLTTDVAVVNGVSYRFRVSAQNVNGYGAASVVSAVYTNPGVLVWSQNFNTDMNNIASGGAVNPATTWERSTASVQEGTHSLHVVTDVYISGILTDKVSTYFDEVHRATFWIRSDTVTEVHAFVMMDQPPYTMGDEVILTLTSDWTEVSLDGPSGASGYIRIQVDNTVLGGVKEFYIDSIVLHSLRQPIV